MKKVIIFGTGPFAELVYYYLTHDSEYEVSAFTVHQNYIQQNEFFNLPLVPFETIEETYPPDQYDMYVALGYKNVNHFRAQMCSEAKSKGYYLISYISSKCTHWPDLKIGENCFIFEHNNIQPFVTIGDDVILWSGNHVGHHSKLGDHLFISSHVVISGFVEIGSYTFIGVNATIRDSIKIGHSCVIGASATIMKPTKDKEVYIAERTPKFKKLSDQINF